MKVLLRESIKRLGRIGDVVNVKDGYARNYLIPKGIAVVESADNLARLAKEKDGLIAAEAQRRGELQAVADRLKQITVAIPMAASEDGRLYGSVTAYAISQAIEQAGGLKVEPRTILLDKPIKELGQHTVKVRLHADVELEQAVFVIQPGAPANPADAEGAEGTAEEKLQASEEAEARRARRKAKAAAAGGAEAAAAGAPGAEAPEGGEKAERPRKSRKPKPADAE